MAGATCNWSRVFKEFLICKSKCKNIAYGTTINDHKINNNNDNGDNYDNNSLS